MSKTYKTRKRFNDAIKRCGEGIFICLAENQVDELDRLAKAAGKSLREYLRDIGEAAIERMIPAK